MSCSRTQCNDIGESQTHGPSVSIQALYMYHQIKMYISVHSDCFILANSADPGEMPYNAAFNLGRHCLSNFTPLGVSRIQRILHVLHVKFISLYTALEHRLDEFHDTLLHVHIAY